ncbi:hypothetical protein GGI02_002096 [Coemansia sp. RSA 2322]|uniref:Palmitoyl-protein thioesterase 1 n=1 Tax=Coemansia thaxteri TaxID=2663907 RepID=A0A9W8EIY4_9FUNG|nr:hypothetical protein H4R26_003034 [Coemansia thaxteri]KAJ2471687.1 hypothetical protein GGI02_002096 [Coemansia sp. RSA 2322]KAJ2484477.1 hypothetical protein EV174_002401 [Coemansia sp. RSA 2320]
MGVITSIIQDELPGAFVHSVKLGSSEGADRNAGFFGNINNQVDAACASLSAIPELQGSGVNLMGFSQGGLFLRALVQRCPSIRAKVLVTFGAPHGGVARIPECTNGDSLCEWMRRLASRGVYSWYIRNHVIQAQYFKDPERIEQYLQYNIFLPDINGELEERNADYRQRILSLEKMVLFRFSEDKMIYPALSPWFGFVDADGNDISMQNTTMYTEDWLGLRELKEAGKLSLATLDGPHMQIGEDILRSIVAEHFGNDLATTPFYVQD